MCMLFCAKKHVTFILNTNRKPTRIHCLGPFCVVHLVIVYVCLPSLQTCLQTLRYILTTQRCTHNQKFLKLTVSFTLYCYYH